MIDVKTGGSFRHTKDFLQRMAADEYFDGLDSYGAAGVAALSRATPVDSALTANSWFYQIERTEKSVRISWHNSHHEGGAPVAILIQYGHATRNGGYVAGRDFINPAMVTIFDQILDDVWKEVTK